MLSVNHNNNNNIPLLLLLGFFLVTTVLCQRDDSCTDRRPDCDFLVAEGYCQTNRLQLQDACPASCKLCGDLPPRRPAGGGGGGGSSAPPRGEDDQCVDKDFSCKSWARNGICRTHGQVMKARCPKSCNFCGKLNQLPSFNNRRTITSPEYDCGRPYTNGVVQPTRSRVVSPIRPHNQQQASSRSSQGNNNPSRPNLQDVDVEDAFCGATVIHQHFILTAAHCVLDPTRPVRSVRLGELDFSKENETNSRPVDYAVETIFVHPAFDPNLVERYNDVALLQTKNPIAFNEVVYPFCLSPTRPPPNSVVTASGFGKVNSTFQSPILQEVELNIISASECEASYRQRNLEGLLRGWYPNLLRGKDVMCAGHPSRGACEGDNGGPLYLDDQDGRRFLVGMVSTAISCKTDDNQPKLPGVYVSIADHIDFIDSVIYGFK